MTTLQLTLPWPPSALSPNARSHWRVLALAKKAYRAECARQALAQGIRRIDAERLHVSLVFVPPSRRVHDLDNLLARFKAGIDGLCDVLGVDDSRWSLSIAKSDEIGGMVKVAIAEVPNLPRCLMSELHDARALAQLAKINKTGVAA